MPATLPAEIITHIFALAEANEKAAAGTAYEPTKSALLWQVSKLSWAWRDYALVKLIRNITFETSDLTPDRPWYEASARVFRLVQTLLSRPALGGAVKLVAIVGTPCDEDEALGLLFLSCTSLSQVLFAEAECRNLDVLQPCVSEWTNRAGAALCCVRG
jgi:hypothetical protein